MLDTLITNKTRVKILLRFFLNPDTASYLRGLEEEFGASTNAIRIELNRFEMAGLLLLSWGDKNRKMFSANKNHPLFGDIQSILRKHTGVDTIVDQVIGNLGNIQSAYLNGLLALGIDHPSVELLLFGDPIDQDYLKILVKKASGLIRREIRYTLLHPGEEADFLKNNRQSLLIWKKLSERNQREKDH
jgi:hypothetical protein